MDYVYAILKALIDPVFLIFILLFVIWIVSLTGKKKGPILGLFFLIVFVYGLSIAPVANYLLYSLEGDYLRRGQENHREYDVLVVLGGGSFDIKPTAETYLQNASLSRLVHGLNWYKRWPSKYFVCSGDGPASVPEAEMMAELALAFGVPKERIRIESKSKTTWENAREVDKIFIRKDLSVGLVTSAFHMKRAEREFQKYCSDVSPLPTDFRYTSPGKYAAVRYLPQTESLYRTSIAFREITGYLWYGIKGL